MHVQLSMFDKPALNPVVRYFEVRHLRTGSTAKIRMLGSTSMQGLKRSLCLRQSSDAPPELENDDEKACFSHMIIACDHEGTGSTGAYGGLVGRRGKKPSEDSQPSCKKTLA